ncbi:MAG: hypothetical protein ACI9TI_001800 [Natronomonas sp.]|jgi:hypothetical protein
MLLTVLLETWVFRPSAAPVAFSAGGVRRGHERPSATLTTTETRDIFRPSPDTHV